MVCNYLQQQELLRAREDESIFLALKILQTNFYIIIEYIGWETQLYMGKLFFAKLKYSHLNFTRRGSLVHTKIFT